MKEIQLVPQAAKGEDAAFEGHVLITPPSFDQRYQYIENAGFELDKEGHVVPGMKQLGAIRKMVELSKHHYKAVALKKKSDGSEYKSFDDLAMDPECDSILIEVASQIMNGFRPSKN